MQGCAAQLPTPEGDGRSTNTEQEADAWSHDVSCRKLSWCVQFVQRHA